MPSSRKVLQKGQQTKQLIIDKALQVFSSKGYHAATVEDIARAAGLAKGTLYQYFKSKKDLLLYFLKNWQESLEQSRLAMWSPDFFKSKKTFLEGLQFSLNSFLEVFAEKAALYKLLNSSREKNVSLEAPLQQSFYQLVRAYEGIFSEAQSLKLIPTEHSPQSLAFYTVSILYQLGSQKALAGTSAQAFQTKSLAAFLCGASAG